MTSLQNSLKIQDNFSFVITSFILTTLSWGEIWLWLVGLSGESRLYVIKVNFCFVKNFTNYTYELSVWFYILINFSIFHYMQLVTELMNSISYISRSTSSIKSRIIPRLSLCSCIKSGSKYNVFFLIKEFFNTTGLGTNICLAWLAGSQFVNTRS